MPLSKFDQIEDSVAVSFDKQQTKLERSDFTTDCSVAPTEDENAVDYWYCILNHPWENNAKTILATLALQPYQSLPQT